MLRRIDRILLRVPNVAAAVKHYRDVLGMKLIREEGRIASFHLGEDGSELVLHSDTDLPGEAVYYLVDDVRELFNRRADLKLQFVHAPIQIARGWRSAIKDPFGSVLLIVDRTGEKSAPGVIEDGKAPGLLFSGVVEERVPVKREVLIKAYEELGRTADDLPYTPDFEKLFHAYSNQHQGNKPTRQEVWRHLLNLRKGGKLPKLGEARSKPPEISPEEREHLRELVGDEIGRRDRLPYTDRFHAIVDQFNKGRQRPLAPHLVWRLVATLAK